MKDIIIRNLTKRYGTETIYEDFSLTVEAGAITCILGPSGCGKTTLLNVLSGLTPYEGTIDNLPPRRSYIFQNDRLIPTMTVRENIEYVAGKGAYLADILAAVELTGAEELYPDELSGGMAKRAAMARAFAYPFELLLLDEPMSSLDLALKVRLTAAFKRLMRLSPRTAIYVTHDPFEAASVGERMLVLSRGKILSDFKGSGDADADYLRLKQILLES